MDTTDFLYFESVQCTFILCTAINTEFTISETPCVKFYHPERRAGQLMQLCRGDECTCAEGKQDDG